ncbi:hypothetical protein [Acinetobacter stercoris]|uniref:Uncharacterized protein n=1 Tax=Acinetobacter stercoris TaxID=2126983 RepID=A0A2U3N2V2_9GAMM|nr:hypothetical protein [Acinetobacter stercoris]SPL72016.1 hypothetical protein KPC_3194 [Acinetobacter stercoris]
MNVLTHKEAKLAWANNEALLINNAAVNGWEEFFPANWGCDVFDAYEFQIKPRIVKIGDIEVAEPIKEPLSKGQQYFVPSLLTEKLANQLKWKNSAIDKTLLERGLIHLTEQDAINHAQAHIIVSGGTIQCNDDLTSNDEIVMFKQPVKENRSDINVVIKEPETIQPEENKSEKESVLEQSSEQDYQSRLQNLIDLAKVATTPKEANALATYTKTWTEEQRKPLLDAINIRLVELDKPNQSLLVRIKNAENIERLNQLEQEVHTCDAFIQPSLNESLSRRRQELTGFPF